MRKRVSSYFTREPHNPRGSLVEAADGVEWIVTANEVEALMLEYTLIQRHRPRFNYRLRDDKSYPYLALTRADEWPRARVMRGARRKGTQYFGPYAHAYAIRSTLDLLLKTFPIRTCSDALFRRQRAMGRPCLLYHIEKCSGPCIGQVTQDDYAEMVDGLASFLQGDTDDVVARLESAMESSATQLEYEQAARYRDQLRDVKRAIARQEVVTDRPENFDLMAFVEDELDAAFQVFKVRRGKVVGRLGTVVDKVEPLDPSELVASMLRELYGADEPPRHVLVQILPPDPELWEAWLSGRRSGPVTLRVPQRGAKRRLLETARANAQEAFERHRMRRQSDHNARARVLRSLQETLGLPEPPLRIEAYDISTIQGTNTVGSMVVMEDGLPKRSDYRHFRVRSLDGQDDFAAMEEVLRRRFQAYLAERERPVHEGRRFSYPPSLVLVDGGVGQLRRAVQVLDELNLEIPAVGLAKRMEEVYVPGEPDPLVIPRSAEALYLLQQVRDEAHRFAVTYHRKLRSKSMIDSILDDVPGIGAVRKKQLLRQFGSLKRMREADRESLAEVVPAAVADDLYAALHGEGRTRARAG